MSVMAAVVMVQALQVAVVASVVRLWRDSPQMAAILVDRCMTLRIVSNLAIVDWVFTRDNLPLFHSSDRVWEVRSLVLPASLPPPCSGLPLGGLLRDLPCSCPTAWLRPRHMTLRTGA